MYRDFSSIMDIESLFIFTLTRSICALFFVVLLLSFLLSWTSIRTRKKISAWHEPIKNAWQSLKHNWCIVRWIFSTGGMINVLFSRLLRLFFGQPLMVPSGHRFWFFVPSQNLPNLCSLPHLKENIPFKTSAWLRAVYVTCAVFIAWTCHKVESASTRSRLEHHHCNNPFWLRATESCTTMKQLLLKHGCYSYLSVIRKVRSLKHVDAN